MPTFEKLKRWWQFRRFRKLVQDEIVAAYKEMGVALIVNKRKMNMMIKEIIEQAMETNNDRRTDKVPVRRRTHKKDHRTIEQTDGSEDED